MLTCQQSSLDSLLKNLPLTKLTGAEVTNLTIEKWLDREDFLFKSESIDLLTSLNVDTEIEIEIEIEDLTFATEKFPRIFDSLLTNFSNFLPLSGAIDLLTGFEREDSEAEEITFVTQRSRLGGNDIVNWSSVERVFDPFAPDFSDFLPNSFSIDSAAGLGVNIDIPPATIPGITPPFVFQTKSEGIKTNFAPEDYILFTGFVPGEFPALGNSQPLTITFDRPVRAAGTQLAVDDLSNFNILLEAFDEQNNSLGLFSVAGTASESLDNSPQFIGIKSETANIQKLVYSYSASSMGAFNSIVEPRAFGINSLSIDNPIIPESSYISSPLIF